MDKDIKQKLQDFENVAKKLGKDPVEVLQYATEQLQKDKKKTSDLTSNVSQLQQSENTSEETFDQHIERTWEKVQLARHQDRPASLEYIELISENYMELHGDRCSGDDKAIVGGICTIDGIHFTFLAHQKGKNMKENIIRHYGMAHSEGYRKALRLAKQAEQFKRPIITFIDTPGAYPGMDSEEKGIGEAIARNLMEFSILRTPIICVVIGEGGSGGALGIGVGDRVYMLENAIYSVISPEGFASILLRDSSKAKEAAVYMKLTAEEIYGYRLIDGIILEPAGGAHNDSITMAKNLKESIMNAYADISNKDIQTLIALRSQKIIDYTRKAEHTAVNKDLLSRIKNFFVK